MSDIAKGWYPDPVDRTIQRYWDGEVWIGDPLPVDATPPDGPPPVSVAQDQVKAQSGGSGATGGAGGMAGGVRTGAVASGAAAHPGGTATGAAAHGVSTPTAPAPGSAVPAPGQAPGGPMYPVPGAGAAYRYPLPLPVPRPHGYALAPLSARLVARLIDILAVLGLNIAVNWWLAYQFWIEIRPYLAEAIRRAEAGQSGTPTTEVSSRANWLLITMLVITVALWFAYEVPAMANDGQTLGKRAMHIKVIRLESTQPLGFRRAWRRWNTLGLPTLLWSFCFVGFLLQFINCLFVLIDRPLHQALHDRAAATVVVAAGSGRPAGAGSSNGEAHEPADPR